MIVLVCYKEATYVTLGNDLDLRIKYITVFLYHTGVTVTNFNVIRHCFMAWLIMEALYYDCKILWSTKD